MRSYWKSQFITASCCLVISLLLLCAMATLVAYTRPSLSRMATNPNPASVSHLVEAIRAAVYYMVPGACILAVAASFNAVRLARKGQAGRKLEQYTRASVDGPGTPLGVTRSRFAGLSWIAFSGLTGSVVVFVLTTLWFLRMSDNIGQMLDQPVAENVKLLITYLRTFTFAVVPSLLVLAAIVSTATLFFCRSDGTTER